MATFLCHNGLAHEGMVLNIVHEHDGKWWFWDESWVHRMGPYNTQDEVVKALKDYCINQLGLTEEQIGLKMPKIEEKSE